MITGWMASTVVDDRIGDVVTAIRALGTGETPGAAARAARRRAGPRGARRQRRGRRASTCDSAT